MTTEEILKLDTSKLSEDTARAYGIDILENNVKPNQDSFKRRGSFTLLFVSSYIILAISDSPKLLTAIILFIACVSLFLFVNALMAKIRWNKTMQQFRTNTFKGGYVTFLKEYQEFLKKEQAKQAQRNELESQKAANKKPSWFRKDKPGQRTKEHISDIANTRARNK